LVSSLAARMASGWLAMLRRCRNFKFAPDSAVEGSGFELMAPV
jgi:hypothetical protein